jgi:hypothetical protein
LAVLLADVSRYRDGGDRTAAGDGTHFVMVEVTGVFT